jgi:hypothetical protein
LILIDDDSNILSRLDRPLLSRQAIKETPLRYEQGTVKDRTKKRGVVWTKSPNDIFFPASLASSISKIKVDEEQVQEKEAERLM